MQGLLKSGNYEIQERDTPKYLKIINIRAREELFSLD